MVSIAYVGWALAQYAGSTLSWDDLRTAASNGALTLARVAVLVFLASVIWVPIGVFVGLRPKLTEIFQPVAQFLAAFPANLFFPVAVFLIVRFDLSPNRWLVPLIDPGHTMVHSVQGHRRRKRVSNPFRGRLLRVFASGPGVGGGRSSCPQTSRTM